MSSSRVYIYIYVYIKSLYVYLYLYPYLYLHQSISIPISISIFIYRNRAMYIMSIMDVMHHIYWGCNALFSTGRFRQLSAIFGSYDYQMKGEDYIDQSPWPINWKQNMEGILRHSMFGKNSCFRMFWVDVAESVLPTLPTGIISYGSKFCTQKLG